MDNRVAANYKYKAFISYSQKADNKLATVVQSALQNFARPRYLGNAMSVFRDKTDLSANPALWPSIQGALSESEFFILLASPQAAKSRWVKRELDYWLQFNNRSTKKFLLIWTAGELPWDEETGRTDWSRVTALPTKLDWNAEDPSPLFLPDILTEEPLYLDFRQLKTAADLSLSNQQFLDEIATLAATLHNRRKSELIGEDAARLRKYRRIRTGVIALLAALLVVATGAAVYANRQKGYAEKSQREAEGALARETVARQEAQAALGRETAAKREAEDRRKEAEEALRRETEAKQQTQKALERETVAKQQAEERRKEAERQTRLAKANLSTSDFLLGEMNLRQGNIKNGLFWNWRAYNDAPRDDLRRAHARAVIASWAAFSGNPAWHNASVDRVKFSPDGQRFVTASRDDLAQIWDAKQQTAIGKAMHHKTRIVALDISPDSKTLLTGSRDTTAQLWNMSTGEPTGPALQHNGYVQSVAFDPGGRLCVTASYDGIAKVWELTQQKTPVLVIDHGGPINVVRFSPDGRTILTAGNDNIRLWDLDSGKLRFNALEHLGVSVARFSPDGKTVVSGGADNAARMWDVTTGQQRDTELMHDDDITAVEFSPDGLKIATGSLDSTVRLWEAATGNPIGSVMKHELPISSVAFSPDSQVLASASYDKTARLWQANTGSLLGAPLKHELGVIDVAISPDGRSVLTGSEDNTARVWNLNLNLPTRVMSPTPSRIDTITISHDGKIIATGNTDGIVQLWNAESAAPIGKPMAHDALLKAIIFSPDDLTLLVATQNALYRWNAATQTLLGKPMPHEIVAMSAAFSEDSQRLATGTGHLENGDSHVRVWNTSTGQPIGRPLIHSDRIASVALSPDGSLVATGCYDRQVRIWDVKTSTIRFTPPVHGEWPKSLVWSPGGKFLFIGTGGTVRIWDVQRGQSGRQLITDGFLEADGWVSIGAISSDSNSIILTKGKTARLWDVPSGLPRGELMRHSSNINAAVLNLSGDQAFTASDDGIMQSWQLLQPRADHDRSLRLLLEWITGYRLESSSEPQLLDTDMLLQHRRKLVQFY